MNERIAIVYMNLGPYHLARMEALARLHPDLLVIEIGAKQDLYPWRPPKENLSFNLETLFDKTVEDVGVNDQRAAIRDCLRTWRPGAVVVSGYSQPVMREAARWARRNGLSTILLFVSTEKDHPRVWWREWGKRLFIMGAYSGIAAAGRRSARYARKLGASREKISVIGNVVDNGRIHALAERSRANPAAERRRLSLPERYFLYVGRLSPEKNLALLIDAYSEYRRLGGDFRLVIIGSGPEEAALKQRAGREGEEWIRFPGWRQFDDLIASYSLAGALILPSVSEPWGLVVNEAMCCGLPVIVSRNCGCVPELCMDGVNALVFDPSDREALALNMLSLSSGELNPDAMGRKSHEIIHSHSPETWAHGLLKATRPFIRR